MSVTPQKKKLKQKFSIFLCLLISLKAFSKDKSTATDTLSSVVVSTLKNPHINPLQSVTIIEGEQLENYHNTDIGQLLGQQSGINVNGANNHLGQNKTLYFRGLDDRHSLILLNGMPLNDNSAIDGAFDIRFIPTEQIERIEIVKGPLASLYGSRAVGGVINIITKKVKAKDGKHGSIKSGYGSYNRKQLSASHGGFLSKRLSYRISAQLDQYDGPSAAKDTSSTTDFDEDGGNLQNINLNLIYYFSPYLNLKLNTLYSDYEIDTDASAYTDDSSTYESKVLNIGTELQHNKNGQGITARHNFTTTDRISKGGSFPSDYKSSQSNFDVFITKSVLKESSLLLGTTRSDFFLKQTDKTIHEYAMEGYANFIFKHQALTIDAGGRASYYKSFSWHGTGSFGAAYQIFNNLKVKALAGSSFRAPTLYELYDNTFGSANADLKPEKSLSYEAGIEGSFFKNAFQYGITAFRNEIENEIGGFPYTNSGKINTKGIELELRSILSKRLMVNGNYTFTEVDNNDGSTALKRPKHRFNVNISYAPIKKLRLNPIVSYRSDQLDFGNVEPKAYTVVNLNISYLHSKNLTAFLNLTNLFDEENSDTAGYTTMPRSFLTGIKYTF